MEENKIRIAIQKSGKLYDESIALLKKMGIECNKKKDRELLTSCKDLPVELLRVRHSDIPRYVESGVADFGIVGENVLIENSYKVDVIKHLDFAKCRVSIAVPKTSNIKNIKDLEGERIATSYPTSLKKFLKNKDIGASIIKINGSVEVAPKLGLSDVIYDIVETGNSLKENDLVELVTIYKSQAVFISNKSVDLENNLIFNKLLSIN